MAKWNFGIVGAGLIADFHARAIGDIDNASVTAVCDVNQEKANALARMYDAKAYADYKEMIQSNDVNIVTIATPSGFHAEPAIEAAKVRKHVLCEKPLDVTLERINAMIQAHKKAGTRLGGIFPYRFNEAVNALKQAILSQRFGTVTYAGIYVPWWRMDEYYKDSWHGTWKLDGGGALMNQSIHMVDMLCNVMPPIESVFAYTNKLAHPQIEAEDTAVAVLRFQGGPLGVMYGTTASWPGQFRRFEITGTKGTVVQVEDSFTVWQFETEQPQDAEIRKSFGQTKSGGGVSDPAAIPYENHTRNFKAFLAAIEGNRDFEIDGKEARKAVQVILAVYQSAKEGRAVKLNLR